MDNYTETYFQKGSTIDEMKAAIFRSGEKEIGFCFSLPWDIDGDRMYEFAKLLRREGFYY